MNKNKARDLALSLMAKHGAGHLSFTFDRARRRIAGCRYVFADGVAVAVEIRLSSIWAEAMSEAEIRDAILHEIAHAKAGYDAGHGIQWRVVARSIGCNAMRCAEISAESRAAAAKIAPALWIGTCPAGHKVEMHRAPQRVRSCGKCSRTFSKANLLTWSKGGKPMRPENINGKYLMEWLRVQAR